MLDELDGLILVSGAVETEEYFHANRRLHKLRGDTFVITDLYDWQIQKLTECRARYSDVIRLTATVDRETSEDVISRLYNSAGLHTPEFIYLDSPYAVQLALNVVKSKEITDTQMDFVGKALSKEIWQRLSDVLVCSIDSSLANRLISMTVPKNMGSLRATSLCIERGLNRSYRDIIVESYYQDVFRCFRGPEHSLEASHRTEKFTCFKNFQYGNSDVGWLSYYGGLRRIGVDYGEQLNSSLLDWKILSVNAHWWLPLRGICFMSERPSVFNADDKIVYRDGFTVDLSK